MGTTVLWCLVSFLLAGLCVLTSCSKSKDSPLAPSPSNIFAPYWYPAWHPSGRAIVFEHDPLVRRYQDAQGKWVYVYSDSLAGESIVNIDGSGQRRLLPYSLKEPEWDSTGTTLAYQIGGTIATMAGSDTGLVTPSAKQITSGARSSMAPTWRSDGQALAYTVFGPTSESGIYLCPSSGGDGLRVGDPSWRQPDWSPTSDSLVFVFSDATRRGIAVADTAGRGNRVVWAYPEADAYYPRWSPDGSRIAFVGRRSAAEGRIKLWTVNADGTGARPLTSTGTLDFFSWGPDGKEIAYVRYDYSDTSLANGTIWVVNVLSGVARQITYNTPSN